MALCKFCGQPFAWGNADGKWTPLVPVGEEGDLDRKYQDQNGNLRASHRDVCVNQGGATVRVSLLAKAIPAGDMLHAPAAPLVEPDPQSIAPPTKKRRSKKGDSQ